MQQAEQIFQTIVDAKSRKSAKNMVLAAITNQADCLRDLGRYEEAAGKYKESIKKAEVLKNTRSIAVGKGQLATVRMLQMCFQDALDGHHEARKLFEQLNEPASVATAWHQIGMVYMDTERFDDAEQAFRESLALRTRCGDESGQAMTLTMLGLLYDFWKRPELAVMVYHQAVEKFVAAQDMYNESKTRSNLAHALFELQRLDDARQEIQRVINCRKSFELWRSWGILHDLEIAAGNSADAAQARCKAIESFLAYRRAGGENHNLSGRLCLAVTQALRTGKVTEVTKELQEHSQQDDVSDSLKALIPALQSILTGNRDPALADDPALGYEDAAEIILLLERLETE
ncbi:MAG: tetratricopeptide repeat protein [Gammaproteobacteria bacterium]